MKSATSKVATTKATTAKPATLKVTPWLLAVCAGIIVALCARLLTCEGNPFGVEFTWPAILATVAAALVVALGIARIVGARKLRDTRSYRAGVLIALVGVFALLASYVGRVALPIILGVEL
jgi:uncharacterized membrane protein HdeD (DUF308 family)